MKRELDFRPASEIPQVPIGEERFFIVDVRRKHSKRIYTFPCLYLNAFVLQYEDEPFERPVTGWFDAESNGNDEASCYLPMLNEGDELIGWASIPVYESDQ